jgi:hypothetical protein
MKRMFSFLLLIVLWLKRHDIMWENRFSHPPPLGGVHLAKGNSHTMKRIPSHCRVLYLPEVKQSRDGTTVKTSGHCGSSLRFSIVSASNILLVNQDDGKLVKITGELPKGRE